MSGILSGPVDGPWQARITFPDVEASTGLRVIHRSSGFMGTIVGLEQGGIAVRSPSGRERLFRLTPGAFLVEGRAVSLVLPRRRPAAAATAALTPSGSVAVGGPARARVARASRILVEGVHDAELVEKVWGDDLRVEGIAVERLNGVDDLVAVVEEFGPGPGSRLGVLVDHLVPGSKEERLAARVSGPDVLVTGTPYVDVWQAVKPAVAGIAAWPEVRRGVEWKGGVLAALGVDEEPGRFWRQLLARVHTYVDLEPALVGAVERLIDFVTTDVDNRLST